MRVKDLLELQSTIEKRITPCDMHDDELNQHFSRSKNVNMNILDMDLIHLVRSYSKCLSTKKINNENLIHQKIDDIINTGYELKGLIKND